VREKTITYFYEKKVVFSSVGGSLCDTLSNRTAGIAVTKTNYSKREVRALYSSRAIIKRESNERV